MNTFEETLIKSGIIDKPIKLLKIDEWFQNAKIIFSANNDSGYIECNFYKCFEVLLKHDENYEKEVSKFGEKNFDYFVQDIEVNIERGLYNFRIFAWPLNAKITCKTIDII